jgi:hypothetical protein
VAWRDGRTAGMLGGVAGSIIGLIGGLIGVLGGLGKARRLVMSLLTFLSGVGVVCLVLGLGALVLSQPYGAYYPLLLLGFTCAIVPTALRGTVRRRFEAIELRRMKAMDVSWSFDRQTEVDIRYLL